MNDRPRIVLTLDRDTATAVLRALVQVGEHFSAGAPLDPLNDPTNPDVQRVAHFMVELDEALGGSGRFA